MSYLVAGLAPMSVSAADWTFVPRVSGSETWSDNITLAPSAAKQHDFVTEITPGIGVQGRGRRLELDFDYQAGLVHYARATKGQEVQHRLQASGNAEIVKDLFFLDIRSTVSQRNQSNAGRRATDGLTLSGNRDQAVTYGISPSIRRRLGSYADVELTYNRDEIDNSGSLSSTLDGVSFRVTSGRRFSGLPWQVSASTRREDNSTGSESTFREVNASFTYAASRRYAVRVLGGYEDNDLAGQRDKGSTGIWRVTGIWSPSPRTDLEIGYGRQSFGNNFSMTASHKMRRAVFNASYEEDITTTSFQQSQGILFDIEDAFGVEIVNPGEQQVDVATDDATLTDETIVARTFNFGVDVRGRRSKGSLNFRNSRREFQRSDRDETVNSLKAKVSRNLSRHTSANAGANWELFDPGGRGEESTQIGLNFGLSHTVFRDVTARVNYRHQRESSDAPNRSYKENRLSANVAVRF